MVCHAKPSQGADAAAGLIDIRVVDYSCGWVSAPTIVGDLTATINPQKPTMTPAFEVRQAVQHPRCSVVYLYSQAQPLIASAAGFNTAAGESAYRRISFGQSADDQAGYRYCGRSADCNLIAEVAYLKGISA